MQGGQLDKLSFFLLAISIYMELYLHHIYLIVIWFISVYSMMTCDVFMRHVYMEKNKMIWFDYKSITGVVFYGKTLATTEHGSMEYRTSDLPVYTM